MVVYFNKKDMLSFGEFCRTVHYTIDNDVLDRWQSHENLKKAENFLISLGIDHRRVLFADYQTFWMHKDGGVSLAIEEGTESDYKPMRVESWRGVSSKMLKEKCDESDVIVFYLDDKSRLVMGKEGVIENIQCAFVKKNEENPLYREESILLGAVSPEDEVRIEQIVEAVCLSHGWRRYDDEIEFIGGQSPKAIIKIYRDIGDDQSEPCRVTEDTVLSLADDEIFVFGSNESGYHGEGAAKMALQWGAEKGQAEGLQGRTYGIPVMDSKSENTLKPKKIKPYVDRFISFAKDNPDKTFLVIEIGCGIAGLKPEDIAPLFEEAKNVTNIHLPQRFWDEL